MTASNLRIAPSRSASWFALATISMVVLSYLIVVAIAAGSAYLSYFLFNYFERLNFQILALAVGCLVISGALLWSLVPKFKKFEAPGLLLDRASQPALFSEIDAIATALNEPLPKEVYLIGDVNAFVAERSGFMSFRADRILAIGLPLFAMFSVSEMRAVLAHEFAHYYGGDTRLGPFIYNAKETLLGTFKNIDAVGAISRVAIIRLLFTVVIHFLVWYFKGFVRAIHSVSRRQEFRADELACYVAGGEAMAQSLRKLRAGSLAWPVYWYSEIASSIDEKVLPPVVVGFTALLQHSDLSQSLAEAAAAQIEAGESSPYDTHPPTRDRIAAIETKQILAGQKNDEPALTLLTNNLEVEKQLVATLDPRIDVNNLRSVAWEDMAEAVVIPDWRKTAADFAPVLCKTTADCLPQSLNAIFEFSRKLPDPPGRLLSSQDRMVHAKYVIGAALAITLVEHGWQLRKAPGLLFLERGADKVNPLDMSHSLGTEQMNQDLWKARCEELGVSGASVWLPSAA